MTINDYTQNREGKLRRFSIITSMWLLTLFYKTEIKSIKHKTVGQCYGFSHYVIFVSIVAESTKLKSSPKRSTTRKEESSAPYLIHQKLANVSCLQAQTFNLRRKPQAKSSTQSKMNVIDHVRDMAAAGLHSNVRILSSLLLTMSNNNP